MTVCPKCGNELPDGTKFCNNCGSAVTSAPASVPAAEAAPEKAKKSPKKAILFCVAGVAVVAVIAAVIALIAGGGKNTKNNYDFYIKDEEIFLRSDKNKSEPWQLTSSLFENFDLDYRMEVEVYESVDINYMLYLSEDGKYIFYPGKINDEDDYCIDLYYKQVNKPDSEAVKVDSDVINYYVNSDSTLVTYTKGEDCDLYQYNIKDDAKDKIASDATGSFRVSDDGKKIIFTNADGNLYFKESGKDKEKLASDVYYIRHISEDFSTVYYIKDETLYKQVIGGDKEKIADDVCYVFNIYDSGEVYYTTEGSQEISLADYVEDDMEKADAAITQPEYPDYPDSPDYPYWFDYDTDEEYDAAYEEYEKAYEKYEEECDKLDEAYYAARDAYWEKLDRDDIREDLEDETFDRTVYSFYYYDGEKSTVLTESATDSYPYDYASDTPLMIYSAYSQSDVEKVKLSEIDSIYDVEDMVREALYSSSEVYVAIKGTATAVKAEDEAMNFRISKDGSIIYYMDNVDDEYTGDLFRISVSNGKLGKAEKYDSDVYLNTSKFIDDTTFAYFKEYKDLKAEMYIDKKKIDFDVYPYRVTKSDSGEIYYFTDYDEDKLSGTLKVYSDKESTKIADDVAMYDVTPDGRVLYLYDYSDKHYTGELYEWNGKEAAKIDEDVSYILPYVDKKMRGIY